MDLILGSLVPGREARFPFYGINLIHIRGICSFSFGEDFELFSFILENYDRIFKLTTEFSKVGGVS